MSPPRTVWWLSGLPCVAVAAGATALLFAAARASASRTPADPAPDPAKASYVMRQSTDTSAETDVLGADGALVATIHVELRQDLAIGTYRLPAGGKLVFHWRQRSETLSVSEAGTRLGVLEVDLASRRWTGDDTSLFVLSRYDRAIVAIVNYLADVGLPAAAEASTFASHGVTPDICYPDYGSLMSVRPFWTSCNGGGAGGDCTGHYMWLTWRQCCSTGFYGFAFADPTRADWDSGYRVQGYACPESNDCPDETTCTNENP